VGSWVFSFGSSLGPGYEFVVLQYSCNDRCYLVTTHIHANGVQTEKVAGNRISDAVHLFCGEELCVVV
jgi:hypothetical protein